MLLAASTQRTIGLVILAIVFIGGLVYLFFNIRSAKAEVGSDVELAANRSPDLRDEDLEGRRLDLALVGNLVMLTVIAIALPFYWLGEPGREEGRNEDTARIFRNRGESIYVEGAQCVSCHGAAGAGGSVTTSLTDDDGNFVAQVVWKAPALNTVLSRFTEDEVLYTLHYGRNGVMPAWGAEGGGPLTDQQLEEVLFYLRDIQIDEDAIAAEVELGLVQRAEEAIIAESPEPFAVAIREATAAVDAALDVVEDGEFDCSDTSPGGEGENPDCVTLSDSQADVLVAQDAGGEELRDAAIARIAEAQAVADLAREMAIAEDPALADDGAEDDLRWAALEMLSTPGVVPGDDLYREYGGYVFTNPAVSGTYSCARCHTFGWSYDAAERFTVEDNGTTEPILPDGYVQGGGAFGPNLTGGSTHTQFETARTHAQFIESGQAIGQSYGNTGDGGNGQMPAFGGTVESDPEGPGIAPSAEFLWPAMLSPDQVDAVVAFERNL